MSPLLVSLTVVILVFIIIFDIYVKDGILGSDMSKRLKEIKHSSYISSEEQKYETRLKNNLKDLIQDNEYKIIFLGKLLDKTEITNKIRKMLKLADIKLTVDMFLIFAGSGPLLCLLLAVLAPASSFVFIVLAITLLYLPFFMVKYKIKKKLDMFTQQFPDALGLISSSLRAGHSLPLSFQMVVQEMPEPICNIFKTVVDEISLGKDTRYALEKMEQYLPDSIDLKFFITSVLIQREIGGNLAEILDSLNNTIRERFKIIGQLKSQTAQAKLSGLILGLAPIFLGLIIGIINPNYLKPLFENILGQILLVFSIIWEIIGFLIIKQITNIRV